MYINSSNCVYILDSCTVMIALFLYVAIIVVLTSNVTYVVSNVLSK